MKRSPEVYRSRRPVKTALLLVAAALVVTLIICVSIFNGFKKYIVITDEGLKMEVPWLQTAEESPESGADDAVFEEPEA